MGDESAEIIYCPALWYVVSAAGDIVVPLPQVGASPSDTGVAVTQVQ